MSERRNIKVSKETFEELKRKKPQHETWDHFLRDILDAAAGGPVVGINDESVERIADEVAGRLGE